jgi:RHS repeat-associated protein
MKAKTIHWPLRATSLVLVVTLAIESIPTCVWAVTSSTPVQPNRAAAPAPDTSSEEGQKVKVNRQPNLGRASLAPRFSGEPTESEIFQAHVFSQPLVPIGAPSKRDNKALAEALTSFLQRTNAENPSVILQFLDQHPRSAWKPSLLLNLGILWRQTGYFSKALAAWEETWSLSKNAEDPKGKALADSAIGELVQINAWVGRYENLGPLLEEIKDRPLIGGASELVSHARMGLWIMDNDPERGFMCGPYALKQIAQFNPDKPTFKLLPPKTPRNGFSLLELREAAANSGIKYQMAKRKPGSPIILNSVIHWKLNHYSALLKEKNGVYLIQDSTFSDFYGRELWISKEALEEESDGYFLVPEGSLPAGWQSVTFEEGQKVWGRGSTHGPDANDYGEKEWKCPTGKCPTNGMAQYNAHLMLVSLNIADIPVGYAPPRGPAMEFQVTYNQKDWTSQTSPNYSNLGSKWTFDFFSYINDAGESGNRDTVTRFGRGGGVFRHNGYSSGTYATDRDGTVLSYNSGNDTYELLLSDGSTEVFAQPSTASGPRKMFLTEIRDPAGNTLTINYDTPGHISTINDALGQTTTFHYDGTDSYRITRVEDPFGRTARFEYDTYGRLKKITDVIGMSSTFVYGSGDFISQLITPYGTSSFSYTEQQDGTRWLILTDPDGNSEKVLYKDNAYSSSESEAPSYVDNVSLQWRNTFYFDKKAYAMATNGSNLSFATIYHWLHDNENLDGSNRILTSGILESIKAPLEGRVWYLYPNQGSSMYTAGTTLRSPSHILRMVDDPANPSNYLIQTNRMDYNDQGRLTKYIDPIGRETTLDYVANGIDLLKIRQTTPQTITSNLDETLAEFANYNSFHCASNYINAAKQTYHLEWNSHGQLTKVTDPKNEITRFNYDTNGYLQTIQRDWNGGTKTTTLTYDGYGRVHIVTESDGYALTYSYDSLDRVTKVTYPDSTFEKYEYSRLDMVRAIDRAGQMTAITYDGVGHPTTVKDRLGQITHYDWCGCGALSSITDPMNHTTTWDRDVLGRVTKKTYHDGKYTQYAYSSRAGNLKSITDAKGQVKNYTNNVDGTLRCVVYSNAAIATASVSFAYDPNYRRVLTMTDGTGTNTFGYNPITSGGTLGARKLASVDGPLANDTITYLYDELGRITNRAINGVGDGYVFDTLGRPTTHTNVLGSFVSAYVNDTFRLASLTAPSPNSQVTTFDYFTDVGDFRLKQILNKNKNGVTLSQFDYQYDTLGRITQWKQQKDTGTPDVMTLDYDQEDELVNAAVAPQGSGLAKAFTYAYDGAGNRTAEQIETTGTGATFSASASTHNTVNQLTNRTLGPVTFRGTVNEPATVMLSANGGGAQAATMKQDPASASNGKIFTRALALPTGSNFISVVATDFNSPSANTSTSNYSVSVVSPESRTYSYDDNGNCTGYTATSGNRSYEWDAEDRLVAISQGTLRSEFTYDGFSRWVKIVEKNNGTPTSTNQFVWCGTELCEERDGSNAVTKRFFPEGEQLIAGNLKCYFTRDHLGTIREMTGNQGNVKARYDYDPYGRRSTNLVTSGAVEADFGFTGHYYHAPSGLHLAMYRAYDADIGRWINRDPIEEEGGLNLYDYVLNNLINRIDPLGSDSVDSTVGTAIAQADEQTLVQLIDENILNEAQMTRVQAALNRFRTKAVDWIAKRCKGSINREFPSEAANKTLGQIRRAAQAGEEWAKKAWKLLNDKRFQK